MKGYLSKWPMWTSFNQQWGYWWKACPQPCMVPPLWRPLGETGFCPCPRASPEILVGSYQMTCITDQVPFRFSYKETQSKFWPTLATAQPLSMYFMNWLYSLASSYSFFIIVLSSSLPNSFSTFILLHCRSSAKPCRKQRREIIPKLCCTLESPEDFWKPLMPGSHLQTFWLDWYGL